jgi:phospholipase C
VIAALALAWGLPRVAATAHAKSPIRYVAATAQAKTPIRHVVVIYLENHSFDNILGFWCDQHSSHCPGAGMPASVRLSNGARVTPSTTPDVVPQVRHQTGDQADAIDGGRMDGWWRIPGCGAPAYGCISGYRPAQIPNTTVLAQDFAISDATFSMQNSPSFFGHLYAIAASTDGFTGNNPSVNSSGSGWGCDSGKKATWAAFPGGPLQRVPTCVPDPALSGPHGRPLANGGAAAPTPVGHVPTILDRFNNARLTWRSALHG